MRALDSVRTAMVTTLVFGCVASVGQDGSGGGPARRRMALIEAARRGPDAIPILTKGLQDDNVVVRRTATRLLGRMGPGGAKGLNQAMTDKDALVRQTAFALLCRSAPDDSTLLALLDGGLRDPLASVRLAAVQRLVAARLPGPSVTPLLERASKDDHDPIRAIAAKALWPFHRDVVPIRERADWDHEVTIVNSIRLPAEDWRFKIDQGRDGHLSGWYKPSFDDRSWSRIGIEKSWQKAGVEHTGVAWYRRDITLPEKPTHVAAELHFQGVDECAWVWINGVYVGKHDIGPTGWDQPFRLDVTKELSWGQKNQITVRAMNTAFAGGIWRPIEVEVLQ